MHVALTIEHAETPLAKYGVEYQSGKKHFRDVPTAERYQTPYRSPQGQLWELDDQLWNSPPNCGTTCRANEGNRRYHSSHRSLTTRRPSKPSREELC